MLYNQHNYIYYKSDNFFKKIQWKIKEYVKLL